MLDRRIVYGSITLNGNPSIKSFDLLGKDGSLVKRLKLT